MRPNQLAYSVLNQLAPMPTDSARECLLRAVTCNRLAKLAIGSTRRKLYRLKDKNIKLALKAHPADVEVCCDHELYPGLMSVRLKDAVHLRLHTHENWLREAC